MIPGSKGNRTK